MRDGQCDVSVGTFPRCYVYVVAHARPDNPHRAGGLKKSTLTGFVGAERQYSMFRHNKFRHLTFDRYVYRSYVYCPHPDTKHTLRPPTPAPDKHSRSRKLRFQRSRLDRGAKSQDDHETNRRPAHTRDIRSRPLFIRRASPVGDAGDLGAHICPAALLPEHGRLLRLPASTVVEPEPDQIELSAPYREQLHSTGAERTADELAFAASGRPREHRRRVSILVPLYGKHAGKIVK